MELDSLEQFRDDSGKLVNVGLGCYRVIYVCKNGDTLCADCAQKSLDAALECGYTIGNEPVDAFSEADTDSYYQCEDCGVILAYEFDTFADVEIDND